jgi:DNA-directed RNA polymerase subunit H (RpoH/RPB5)
MATSEFTNKLFKSRKIIMYYLEYCGFNCETYKTFTYQDINTLNETSSLNISVKNDETNERCKVIYLIDNKTTKPQTISDIIEKLYNTEENPNEKLNNKTDNVIIVTQSYTIDSVHSILNKFWDKENIFAVIFGLDYLMFNVLTHTFVPKHIKLNKNEKDEMFNTFNINDDSQVPEISRYDPVAKAIQLRPGEVCKIMRYDKKSFNNVYYRICVE